MVEGFFDEEPVDAVAVEDEVGAVGVLISNHATADEMVSTLPHGLVDGDMANANLRK